VDGASRDVLEHALELHRQGQLDAAERAYLAVLRAWPGQFDALHLLGVIESARGRPVEALGWLERALQAAPAHAGAHNHRGVALRALGRSAQAQAAFEHAVDLQADHVPAWVNLAAVLLDQDQAAASAGAAGQALALAPLAHDARFNLGCAQLELGRIAEALASFAAVPPGHAAFAGAALNMARAQRRLGRLQDALSSCDAGLAAPAPAPLLRAELLVCRGIVLLDLGRAEDAGQAGQTALAALPDHGPALAVLARALLQQGRPDEARVWLDRRLAAAPDDAVAWQDRGHACAASGQPDQALADYSRALALQPLAPGLQGQWLAMKLRCADWQGLDGAYERLAADLEQGRPVAAPFHLTLTPLPPRLQRQGAALFVRQQTGHLRAEPLPARPAPGRLRLAYVSADWRDHPTMDLLLPVFAHHDRTRFELIGVGLTPVGDDALGRQAVRAMDRFIDVHGLDDDAATARLRALDLHLALDLNLHTQGARLGLWARRIAPLQLAYLGFPGSSGSDFHDLLVADAQVVPSAQRPHCSEALLLLPDCYLPGDREHASAAPTPRHEHGLPEVGFVFCCSNHTAKIQPAIFEVWMDLLRELPASVLWLRDPFGAAVPRLREAARARGVDPQRLVFAPQRSREAYLAQLPLADLFLDTWPYNAHTTGLEALRAGLPLLTLAGDTFASRVGASLLHAAGLPELVAHDVDDYRAKALQLAGSPVLLAGLRARLQASRSSAPLFDTARYTRAFEHGLLQAWRQGLAGAGASVQQDIIVPAMSASHQAE